MAVYETKQTGDWSNSLTWGNLGIPGDGDTVNIIHNVNVDIPVTLGTGGDTETVVLTVTRASLTLLSTLTLKGCMLLSNAPLTLNPGSVLEFDPAAGVTYWLQIGNEAYSTAKLLLNGTAGNRCAVRKRAGAAGHVKIVGQAGQDIYDLGVATGSYCDFTGLGSATVDAWTFQPFFSQNVFSLDHCTFTGCGRLNQVLPTQPGVTVRLTRCRWVNTPIGTPSNVFLQANTPKTGGTREVIGNVFDAVCLLDSSNDFTVEDNVFLACYSSQSGRLASFRRNLICIPATSPVTGLAEDGPRAIGHYIDNYILWTGPNRDNPHGTNTVGEDDQDFIGNVFDVALSRDFKGDMILANYGPTSRQKTIRVLRNLVLPNLAGNSPGELVSPLNINNYWTVDHNTVVSTGGPSVNETGVATYGEGNAGYAGLYQSIRSNLVYSPAGKGPGAVLVRHQAGTVSDVVAKDDAGNVLADYNALNNPITAVDATYVQVPKAGYVHAKLGGTPTPTTQLFTDTTGLGAHDLIIDPQLVDPAARTFLKWCRQVRGHSTPFDPTDQAAELAAAQADLTAGLADIAADVTLIASMSAWVKAGYAPQNPALHNAGHDNATVGAVEYAPVGAALAAGVASVSGIGEIGLSLSWTAASGGTGTYTYRAQQATDDGNAPGVWKNLGAAPTTQLQYDFNPGEGINGVVNLTPDKKYWFRVAAIGSDGAVAYSAPVPATTLPPAALPATFEAGLAVYEARLPGEFAAKDAVLAALNTDNYNANAHLNHDLIFAGLRALSIEPGNAAMSDYVAQGRRLFRDDYVVTRRNGNPDGPYILGEGLSLGFRQGNTADGDALLLIRQHSGNIVNGVDLSDWVYSREVAYTLTVFVEAERCGLASKDVPRFTDMLSWCLGHVDQFTDPGKGWATDPNSLGIHYIQPFMMGLTAMALINYLEYTETNGGGDQRVQPKVLKLMNFAWPYFRQTDGKFPLRIYPDFPSNEDSQYDNSWSNFLAAPMAWLYHRTGDTVWKDRAGKIFAAAATCHTLYGPKQLNELTRYAPDAIRWLTEAPLVIPSGGLTVTQQDIDAIAAAVVSLLSSTPLVFRSQDGRQTPTVMDGLASAWVDCNGVVNKYAPGSGATLFRSH